MKDLTKGSITKLIFWFALPVFIGSLLQMTYNLVDTKIIGYVLGESSLAAVGSTNSVNTLVIGFLQGLTNGFAVIAAQFFGAGDTVNFKRTVAGSFKYGIMISAGLTVVVLIFLRPLLKVLNTPEDLLKEAYDYIFIIFAGMTILMLYNVCAALLRSIGDSFTPLIFLGISVVLNIGGDLFFLKVIPMGVRGAAVATVLSQLIALIACLIYSLKRYNILWISRKDFKTDASLCGKLMSTGCSMGFMSSLVSLGSVTLQSAINSFGQDIILAHTTARRLSELFMMMFGVLGTTMATFCGQNLGAGRIDRIKKGIGLAILYTCIWCSFTIVASYTIGDWLVYMVTGSKNAEVLKNATNYLKFDTLFYFVTAVICVVRNAMQGLGDHITPLVSSSLEMIGKIVIAATLVPWFGYTGVIVAEPLVWFIMVIPLLIQIFRMPVLKNNILTKS